MKRRTVVRGVVLAVLLLTLGLLVAYAAASAWARKRWAESSARFEREAGSLDLRSWELPDVPVERNAATWIARGAAALVLTQVNSTPAIPDLSVTRPSNCREVAAFRQAVSLNRDGLAVLAHARGLEDSTFGVPVRQGSNAKLPNLLQISDAAKLVFARGSLSLCDGDRTSAISDATLLGEIARALQREHTLIAVLVGINLERYQLRLIQAVIENPALSPEELRTVSAGVLRQDVRADYARATTAEGAATCQELRASSIWIGTGRQDAIQPAFGFVPAAIGDALAALCLDAYRETSASMNAPVLTIADRKQEAKLRLRAAWGSRLAPKLDFPNLFNGSERAWLTLELRRLTRAAALLRERSWKEGAYPADLVWLPANAAPDPEGTGAWTYERRADGSAHLMAPAAAAFAGKVLFRGQADVAPFSWSLPAPRQR